MAEDWTTDELSAATRTYLWMLRSQQTGYMVNKTRVRNALLAGPLRSRNKSSIEFRFQNISSVLANMHRAWVTGYRPAKNVGQNVAALIANAIEEYEQGGRSMKSLNWLITHLPAETILESARQLADGKAFDFDASTTYDIFVKNGATVAPKAVIGLAAQLHYGAPLIAVDFSGGAETPCFDRLREAGLQIGTKAGPESEDFRQAVRRAKKASIRSLPIGNKHPSKTETKATAFVRSPDVVAFVEDRAGATCERCHEPAPFNRPTGEPYLEVHHIIPLSERGEDVTENCAALCPNCHRRCHSGADAKEIRPELLERIREKHAAYCLRLGISLTMPQGGKG